MRKTNIDFEMYANKIWTPDQRRVRHLETGMPWVTFRTGRPFSHEGVFLALACYVFSRREYILED